MFEYARMKHDGISSWMKTVWLRSDGWLEPGLLQDLGHKVHPGSGTACQHLHMRLKRDPDG